MSAHKMNPELKKKWLAALRSGKYAQTKGRLHDDNGFCCWGVLCDVIAPDAWVRKTDINGNERDNFGFMSVDHSAMPPKVVLEAANIPHHAYRLTYELVKGESLEGHDAYGILQRTESDIEKDDYDDLASLNDRGKPFSYIADIIEREF